ncbi:PAS domain S-box protein [Mucilaginibacter robiniae]|uniref:histidine kinase n=1 Tax=Mucilaginibacter robiniae TaxID=2728022 RepID=A0A7L5E0W7_9SPHI|nr:ATP-binding protein [Mucilaginibacter robiniae]QJD95929.1 PAS domain S-box protein [Mucilaginibacter robiniae]
MSNHSSLSTAEVARLAALQSYHILDTATDEDFEQLTELASVICETPISLISFVDEDRQWFKSSRGLDVQQTSREQSFCAHAILKPDELMQVEDARRDERFKDNPLVTGQPNIVFYAGVPLVDEEGHALGSLCVIDRHSRQLTPAQQKGLQLLAKQVMEKLQLRKRLIDMQNSSDRTMRIHQLLVVSEQELREIVNHLPEPTGVYVGEELIIRYANPSMLSIMGKDVAVIGMPYHLALPELAAEDFPTLMRRVMQTGVAYEQRQARISFVHNGTFKEFYFDYRLTPLRNEQGQVWGLLNTAVDVTQAVKAQFKAKRAEDMFRLAVSTAGMGDWHLDSRNNLLYASPRTKELFGYLPEDEMPLDAAISQITDEYRDLVSKAIKAAVDEGRAYDLEYPIIGHRDGELRWVKATGKLYPDELGNMTDFLGTLLDITERKLEEQRREDFIGIVSHELRSPLTSLNGYVQMLELTASKSANTKLADIAIKARRQVIRMEALIAGFLDVARMKEGKIALNERALDMADLVRIAEEESLATITSHHVIFHPVAYTPVYADRDKIEQVIVNFINNAVKYSAKNSTIHVACITRNGMAHVSVVDEGMGIPVKDQPHIFNRFYRVEGKHTLKIKGFGIGLYICKEIIERHKGQIGVESVEGKGSAFWFQIPIHP